MKGLFPLPDVFDTLYRNGTIYPVDDELAASDGKPREVEAVGTRGGRIVYAGTLAGALGHVGASTRIFDLEGGVMLPGFIDAHGHFPDQGFFDLHRVNLRSAPMGHIRNFAELSAALKAKAEQTPPGEWVIGYGYDHNKLEEGRHPDRLLLDAVSERHPIFIIHACDNMSVANSLALSLSRITKGSARARADGVEIDADGEPTGLLLSRPAQSFLEPVQKVDEMEVVAHASALYASKGVTTAENAGIESVFDVWAEALAKGALRIRAVFNPPARVLAIPRGDGGFEIVDTGIASRRMLGWSDPEDLDKAAPPAGMRQGVDLSNLKTPPGATPLPENFILHGRWKMQYDGSPQGRTSYNKRPGHYAPDPALAADDADREGGRPYYSSRSVLNMFQEDLERWIAFYHRNGQSVEAHGNGDKAIEHIIAAFEKAVAAPEAAGIGDMRHGVIHAQFMERQHIERQQGLYPYARSGELPPEIVDRYGGPDCLEGVYRDGRVDRELLEALDGGEKMRAQHFTNTFFINHTWFWGKEHRDVYLGPGRALQMSPVGWAACYGQRATLHNDTPVTPMDPLRSVQSAVTRLSCEGEAIFGHGRDLDAVIDSFSQDPAAVPGARKKAYWDFDQRISVLRALRGVTIDAAYQKHLDHLIGSIEPGKLADFVILGADPFRVEPTRIADIPIRATIVGDALVHSQPSEEK